MDWSREIENYLGSLSPVKIDLELAQRVVALMDLTTLKSTDSEASVASFCEQARTIYGDVAGVCVYPQFVRIVAETFKGTPIKPITVANFPDGNSSLEKVLIEINQSLENEAKELDIVFPYARYLQGDNNFAEDFVSACKAACGKDAKLKIILETGKLQDFSLIAEAAALVLQNGADFVKTSTGKIAEGATLEAAAVLLITVRDLAQKTGQDYGVKVAGGIKTLEQAAIFIELANKIIGKDKVRPENFRIGSSSLLKDLLAKNRLV